MMLACVGEGAAVDQADENHSGKAATE